MADNRDNDITTLIQDVTRHMRTSAHQLAQKYGISRTQLFIIARLDRQPDISQAELACALEVTPTTIARLINHLEELGFVKRCEDPEDGRFWRLQLRPAAAPLRREISRLRAKLRGAMTIGLDPETVAVMIAGLRKMKANLTQRHALAAE